jgi:hypothetical protein
MEEQWEAVNFKAIALFFMSVDSNFCLSFLRDCLTVSEIIYA